MNVRGEPECCAYHWVCCSLCPCWLACCSDACRRPCCSIQTCMLESLLCHALPISYAVPAKHQNSPKKARNCRVTNMLNHAAWACYDSRLPFAVCFMQSQEVHCWESALQAHAGAGIRLECIACGRTDHHSLGEPRE